MNNLARVFDAMRKIPGKPSSEELGLEPLVVMTMGAWKTHTYPDDARILKSAKMVQLSYPGHSVVVDFEFLNWRDSTVGEWADHLAKCVEILDKLRTIWSDADQPIPELAYFSQAPPAYNGWTITEHYRRCAGIAGAILVPAVDFLVPEVYFRRKNVDEHNSRQLVELEACKQYGKPIYPIMFAEARWSRRPLVDGDYWRTAMKFALRHGDGVILWGERDRPWDSQWPWWVETQKIIIEASR